MDLTLQEKIQLLRKRLGLNQGQFGAKAFNISEEAGRTKIKNIELGKQKPSTDDLVQMAKVLDISFTQLRQTHVDTAVDPDSPREGVLVDQAVLDRFQQLGPYLEMLNRAVSIDDQELIDHIAVKLASVFTQSSQLMAINS